MSDIFEEYKTEVREVGSGLEKLGSLALRLGLYEVAELTAKYMGDVMDAHEDRDIRL